MTVDLGIDFGTSNTAAVLRIHGGQYEPVLFDAVPVMPSAVFADPGGGLLTGRDAVFSARLAPERFEPNPKLRDDDGGVYLGVDVAVTELFAAVLSRVTQEARNTAGHAIDRVMLTHPVAWGPRRLAVLREAAGRAGLETVALMPEPTAAATYFRIERRNMVADEPDTAVIYDFGAGTFDVSVVAGSRVLAFGGLTDAGRLRRPHLGQALFRSRLHRFEA